MKRGQQTAAPYRARIVDEPTKSDWQRGRAVRREHRPLATRPSQAICSPLRRVGDDYDLKGRSPKGCEFTSLF